VRDLLGIVSRDGDGTVHASCRAPYIDDLDSLPFPAWDVLGRRVSAPLRSVDLQLPLHADGDARDVARLPVLVHVLRPLHVGKLGRYHSVEYVMEMCRHAGARGARHVIFYDDLFTVKKKRVVELCEAMVRAKLPFTWSCNSHPTCSISRPCSS
jgi:hypothetical protein